MFQLESVNRNLYVRCQTFSKKAYFSHAALKKINERRSSILADKREENKLIW